MNGVAHLLRLQRVGAAQPLYTLPALETVLAARVDDQRLELLEASLVCLPQAVIADIEERKVFQAHSCNQEGPEAWREGGLESVGEPAQPL